MSNFLEKYAAKKYSDWTGGSAADVAGAFGQSAVAAAQPQPDLSVFINPFPGQDKRTRDALAAAQGTWEKTYQPLYEQYSQQLADEARRAMDRQMSMSRAHLGYAASAGPGTAGTWDAARLGLERAGMQQYTDIASMYPRMVSEAHINYLLGREQFSQQVQLAQMQFQHQQRLAEMNQPGWWEGLTSIVGTVAAFWAYGKFIK